jgi:hypothetical protein
MTSCQDMSAANPMLASLSTPLFQCKSTLDFQKPWNQMAPWSEYSLWGIIHNGIQPSSLDPAGESGSAGLLTARFRGSLTAIRESLTKQFPNNSGPSSAQPSACLAEGPRQHARPTSSLRIEALGNLSGWKIPSDHFTFLLSLAISALKLSPPRAESLGR